MTVVNKQITVQAETLEQARRDAALQLGVEEQEILFEILQMPQKKKLGLFGGSPAIVRATAQQAGARTHLPNADTIALREAVRD